jgi:predicted enzyme related to lactoylglutathione lyase
VYFGSDDLDVSTRQVKELGGQVVVPPMVIPSGGRFAVAQDPQGAFFAMFQGRFDD